MRTKNDFFYRAMCALLATCLFLPLALNASEEGEKRERDKRSTRREMLEELLDMPSERLARVRSLVERLEAMEAEEREELRKRVRRFHRQTAEEIKRQRERWREMSDEEKTKLRRKLREKWKGLWPAEEAGEDVDPQLERRFTDYFRKLPREERRRIMQTLRTEVSRDGVKRE